MAGGEGVVAGSACVLETFRQVDPLYVVDLERPFGILGLLEQRDRQSARGGQCE